MKTKISTADLRNGNLIFENIPNGSMFTSQDFDTPFIKMPIFTLVVNEYDAKVTSQEEEEEFNAVNLYGTPYWFDYDHEVESINEIHITMK